MENTNTRFLGTMTHLSKKKAVALLKRLPVRFQKRSDPWCVYQVGDFQVVFSLPGALNGYIDCEWSVVTDTNTGEPLALVPSRQDYDAKDIKELRCLFEIFSTIPIVFACNGVIYWKEQNYEPDSTSLGRFPLIPLKEDEKEVEE